MKAKESTLQLLSQIENPTEEQSGLIDYVTKLLDNPDTKANKKIVAECLGAIWMMIK